MATSPEAGNSTQGKGAGAPRRVFITGVTGFLGTALAERLVEQGARVTGLVRGSSSTDTLRWLERLGVRLVEGDVAADEVCPGGLAAALDDAELVIHSAAVIGYRRRLRGMMARTNVLGTRRVVGACLAAGTPRMLHVSSIAAVGVSDRPVLLDEDAVWNAHVLDAPYFDTKHEAEREVREGIGRGLDAVIVNPGAIYGPSRVPANSSNIVRQVLAGRVRFAPPAGVNVVPLETVVAGCLAAAGRGACGRRYILGGENLELAALVQRIARAGGLELAPRTVPAWTGGVGRALLDCVEPFVPQRLWFTPDMLSMFGRWMWFDTRRAEQELGVEPGDLDACLRATVEQVRRR